MLSRTQKEFTRLDERPAELDAIAEMVANKESSPPKEREGKEGTSSKPQTKQEAGKTKLCTKCKTHKPVGRFPPHKDTRDGLAAHCKDCRAVLRKRRNQVNFEAKLKHHFAARMSQQLASPVTGKPPPQLVEKMEIYLGYKMSELVTHLDEDIQEREGISLKVAFDRGYHVDHITPLSKFKVGHLEDSEFRKCWAIDNLRMMDADENLKKGSKDIYEDD